MPDHVETTETEAGPSDEQTAPVFAFPARVTPLSTRQKSRATREAELLEIAREAAPDPSSLDEHPPFFFSAVVSTDLLDSYFTHMHRSSLENFATQLTNGISLQDSHDTRRLGLGQSLAGTFIRSNGTLPSRTIGDFMILPGLNVSGTPTSNVIAAIRGGAVRDMSAGFYGGQWICDLCGEPVWGGDLDRATCPHFPGRTYEVRGEPKLATAEIRDASLAEASLVYDGATPGAGVLKARAAALDGRLKPDEIAQLETCYRIKLPAATRLFAGVALQREEASMPDNEGRGAPPIPDLPPPAPVPAKDELLVDAGHLRAVIEEARAVLTEAGTPPAAETEPVTLLRAVILENKRLRPRALEGDQYRHDLLERVITEGTRAYGNQFPAESERAMLASQEPATLKARAEFYQRIADTTLGGGRVTTDTGEPPPPPTPARDIPLAAYRV